MTTRTLVLGMVDAEGVLRASELLDVARAGGYTVHQVRLCLARLVQEGLFTQEGRGRKAVFTATSAGRDQLVPEVEFLALAFAQDAGLAPWDEHWHLVSFSIGEDRRAARNALRELLVRLGAPLSSGLYVCAHDWDLEVLAEAKDRNVSEHVVLASTSELRVANETDPQLIARQVWDLDQIGRDWRAFTAEFRPFVERIERAIAKGPPPADRAAMLADIITVSAGFEQRMQADPLLPPELLPKRWPGADGRRLILRLDQALIPLRRDNPTPQLFGRYDAVFDEAHRTARQPSR